MISPDLSDLVTDIGDAAKQLGTARSGDDVWTPRIRWENGDLFRYWRLGVVQYRYLCFV